MYYYQRLRDLREDKDLKQEDIAKIIETTQTQYSRWERGAQEMPFHNIITLAKYYNVSLDYIAGLTNDKRGIGYTESKYTINQSGSFNRQTIKIKEK